MNTRSSRSLLWEDIRALPYYYENFGSTDAVSSYIKKKSKGKVGSYLLRPSNRNRELLTASVLVPDNSIRHTHIQIEDNGPRCQIFLVVEKKFNNIYDLIAFYARNPVKNLENVSNVYFQWPICKHGTVGTPESVHNGFHRSQSNLSISSRGSSNVSNGHIGPPPLPIRPSESCESFGSSPSGNSLASQERRPSVNSLSTLDRRPPLPLPPGAGAQSLNPPEGNPYYSMARDVSEDISERLKEVLKTSERCECGIPRILAELPLEWTVHLSKDAQTAGRLFYQNNEGVTSWTLPEHVRMQLTKTHKTNLSAIEQRFVVKKMVKKDSTSDVRDVHNV